MKPYTEKIPKAMIPVLGRPFVDWQLSLLKRQGISSVVICIGYLGSMIRDYVSDGSRFGFQVEYIDEGARLRGTAGAIRFAVETADLDDSFFVLYGDSYLPISYPEVFERFREGDDPALMTVFRNDGQFDKSNVRYNGRRVTLYDKTLSDDSSLSYIDYGLSVLSKNLVKERVQLEGAADLAGLFHQLSVEGKLAGFEVRQRFYEIGSKQGLNDLEKYLGS
jgi:NDP-sugar pyrophosphorylase family protein